MPICLYAYTYAEGRVVVDLKSDCRPTIGSRESSCMQFPCYYLVPSSRYGGAACRHPWALGPVEKAS